MGSITVNSLGKAYRQYPGRLSRLLEWITQRPRHTLKWVLKDVSFHVKPGESVGIIGINGAGKSTLLKLVTGTCHPTSGSIKLSGRVAALLELGMGFHPDFSGRQNVFMAGQLLGISTREIDHLLPEIEAFAEIGEYIDMPVRVYSSGMQVRLAFSVATVIRPDILIVDEALSVGDAYFQHKSFDRIREFRRKGTTLLIVSHDKQAIQSICDRAILINAGHIAMEGEPEVVMDYYNALLAGEQNQRVKQEVLANGKIRTISGTSEVVIREVRLVNSAGQPIEVVPVGESIQLIICTETHQAIPELVVGFMIRDRLGQPIFGSNSHHLRQVIKEVKPGEKITFKIGFDANFGPGNYSITVALHSSDNHVGRNYHWMDMAAFFTVTNQDKPQFVGSTWIHTTLSCTHE